MLKESSRFWSIFWLVSFGSGTLNMYCFTVIRVELIKFRSQLCPLQCACCCLVADTLYSGFWKFGGEQYHGSLSIQSGEPTSDNERLNIHWAYTNPGVVYCNATCREARAADSTWAHSALWGVLTKSLLLDQYSLSQSQTVEEKDWTGACPPSKRTSDDLGWLWIPVSTPLSLKCIHYVRLRYREETNRMMRNRRKRPRPGSQAWEWDQTQTPPQGLPLSNF